MLSGSTGVHDMNHNDRYTTLAGYWRSRSTGEKVLDLTVIATLVLIFVASFYTAYAIHNAPWQGGA